MKKNNILRVTISIVVISMVMFTSVLLFSCKSKDADKMMDGRPEIEDKREKVGKHKDVPSFFLNPPISKDVFYGVGTAKMKKLNAAKKAATARARDDIAFQISAQIQSSISDYYQESGAEEDSQAISFYESVSRQITDTVLQGTTPEKFESGKDGTIYALVSYPKENLLKEAEKAFVRNEDAAFAEFKAQEALKRLDAQISDKPTTAGQNN